MKTILKRSVTHDVQIPLSGEDIAELFWNLDDHGQALFFNALGKCDGLSFQLYAVSGNEVLNAEGRVAMSRIGEYSTP